MAKKKTKGGKFKGKKRDSILGTVFVFSLVCFLIGIFIAKKDLSRKDVPAVSKEVKRNFPEKVHVEEESEGNSVKEEALKPEDLTFFETLLAEPDMESGNVTSEKKSPKSAKSEPGEPPVVNTENPEPRKEAAEGSPQENNNRGRFKIQVASFPLRIEAEHMKEDLIIRGFGVPVIKTVEVEGRGTWYRIYMGKYESLEEAKKAEKKIREKGRLATLIVYE